jgi:hypothetical protein
MSEPETPPGPDDDGRFVEQVLLALDGQLGPEEDASLKASLAADAENRRLFVRLCLQTQALFEVLGAHRQPGGRAADAHSRYLGWVAFRSRRAWAIAAGACLLSLVPTWWALHDRRPHDPPASRPDLAVAEGQQGPVGRRHGGPGPGDVAMVVALDGARWDPSGGAPPSSGELLGARRLGLRSGRATLVFLSGVTLTLEGPADVDLVAIDRVFCRRGRLRARVPEGAEGFVVASPESAVVDLGTEFAVNVDADGRSRVFVFEGLAEAALLDRGGSPKLTQIVERSKAFDLDPRTGRIAEADARPDRFVQAPVHATPSLVLDPSYPGAVMGLRPKGYWRFDSIDGGSSPNEVPGGPPLRANGPVELTGGQGGNGCAIFRAGEPDQFLSTDALWELAREPGHAVEMWFLSEGISNATLVGLFPPKDHLAPGKHGRFVHTLLVELTAHDRGSLFKPASVRFLHRWPLDTRIGNNVVSEALYVPGRWHHVVAQKDGDQLELYFDGELDRAMPLGTDHPTLSCRLVVGRRTPDPLEQQDRRPFVGRIDEFAIYDRPLTADEVRGHFRLGRTEGPAHEHRNES